MRKLNLTICYSYCKISSMYKLKIKNLILLSTFAAAFSLVVGAAFVADRRSIEASASGSTNSENEEVVVVTTAVNNSELDAVIDNDGTSDTVETLVATDNTEATVQTLPYTVTKLDVAATLYTSDTINVRAAAGTEYDKIGKLSWGSAIQATGVTDNGWYEIVYNDSVGYVSGEYVTDSLPGVPYLFVGDSRTVQLQMAVGSTDKAYIAKVGEGYSWFKNTAISEIQEYAGQGTVMVINFGVNDLANASKYINLVNSYIDTWTAAGITVYYSSVTPVGSCGSVSNEQIESFNAKLQAELDPRVQWIDSYSYLTQTGFSSSDGLHYNKSTYKNLYSYYMSIIDV